MDSFSELGAHLSRGRCPECGNAWAGINWMREDPATGEMTPEPTVPNSFVPCKMCHELRDTLEDDAILDVVVRPVTRERMAAIRAAQREESLGD